MTEPRQTEAPDVGGEIPDVDKVNAAADRDPMLEAESLLAVVGLGAVLEPGKLRTRFEQRQRARGLEAEFRRRIRRYASGKDVPREKVRRAFSWPTISARISRAVNPDILAEAIGAVTDGDTGILFATVVGRALELARSEMPAGARRSLAGASPRQPSESELSRFRRTWGVLDDGTSILRLMETGLLAVDEVRTFALVFPKLYGIARRAFFEAVARGKARDIDFAIVGTRARVLERLLQVSMVDVQAMQEIYAKEQEGGDGGGGGVSSAAAKDTLSTPVQKLADGAR